MRVRNFVLLFILTVIIVSKSSAQNLPPDSVVYGAIPQQVIDQFNTTIANQSELFNGALYELYAPANKGTFYFLDKNYCVPALIRYDHTWYKNIPILYDVYNDAMVSVSGNNLYVLRPGKLSELYFLDHHFIYVETGGAEGPAPGYYDQLYPGRSKVLVKRSKRINDTKTTEIVYEDRSDIYVKRYNKYYLVNSKGSLLDIFKNKKKELNQYLDNSKIRYNKDKEGAVARLAIYYDQISN